MKWLVRGASDPEGKRVILPPLASHVWLQVNLNALHLHPHFQTTEKSVLTFTEQAWLREASLEKDWKERKMSN